jgi:mono/diheme cytochrome c family protein
MRRTALFFVVASLVFAAGMTIAGCGGEEEASPTPDTITGTDTETTDEETTDEETTDETETDGGEGGGDPAAGKSIFTEDCGSCHTLADAGTSGTVGPNLDDSQPSHDLVVDRVTNGRGVMPAFQDTLSEDEIQNVAAYVVQATS